jgi:hypothetical protein
MIVNIAKFSETFARFEQADRHKTEFLCRMSHELRYLNYNICGGDNQSLLFLTRKKLAHSDTLTTAC